MPMCRGRGKGASQGSRALLAVSPKRDAISTRGAFPRPEGFGQTSAREVK